jgi:hypothetical protein
MIVVYFRDDCCAERRALSEQAAGDTVDAGRKEVPAVSSRSRMHNSQQVAEQASSCAQLEGNYLDFPNVKINEGASEAA